MLENITRYVEHGEKPLAAAFKGASEIGFTIVSISVSLVAVLIPLLLMGPVIGRLFREFAVTLAMAIFVSMMVSLDIDADYGFALSARQQRDPAWAVRPMERAPVQSDAAFLTQRGPRSRPRLEQDNACHLLRHHRAFRLPLHDHSEGLFPQQQTAF